jgi:predicted membrane metal-binding protein
LPLDAPPLLDILLPRLAQRADGVERLSRALGCWLLILLLFVLLVIFLVLLLVLLIIFFVFLILLILLLVLLIPILVPLLLLLVIVVVVEDLHPAARLAAVLVRQQRLRDIHPRGRTEA